jgi:uncharacterized protein (UPF0297 family)
MEIPVSIVLSPEALASLRGSTGPTLFDKSESINNLTDNQYFINEVASRIHPREIAEQIDTDDLAEEMTRKVELDAGEIAGYIDVESVAGYIDPEEIANHFDADDIASRIDMEDIVESLPMGRLANALAKQIVENPSLREALVESFINRLTHSLLPKSST